MARTLMLGVTLLALVTFGFARLDPGGVAGEAGAVASLILFLQFPLYLCALVAGTATLELGIGPLEFRADIPPPPGPSPARPMVATARGSARLALLVAGLALGLPAVALAAIVVARETGHLLAPIPLVFTPTLALATLLRWPRRQDPDAGHPTASP